MGRESKAVGLLQAAESDFEGVGDLSRLLGFVCTYDWAIAWTIIVFMKSDQWSESFHSEVFHCLMSFSLRSAVQVSCLNFYWMFICFKFHDITCSLIQTGFLPLDSFRIQLILRLCIFFTRLTRKELWNCGCSHALIFDDS